jgi:chromate transporter
VVLEVLRVALILGVTSFGGPVAHLGYFRRTYVERRRWLDEATFADLVALCQSLPGPASSQLGIAIGTLRAGLAGGIAAWVGFTLPSALALIAFGLFASNADLADAGWVHGLQVAAAAVVAQAVIGMARRLTPDAPRLILAGIAAAIALALPMPWIQFALIVGGALVGGLLLRVEPPAARDASVTSPIGARFGVAALVVLAALLLLLPLVAVSAGETAMLVDRLVRTGALVFGGGHVVLPLLQNAVVDPGWVSSDAFLAGYGAAQAVPGPLFTFAAFLGTVASVPPGGLAGGLIATIAIFLPSFLLVWGTLPFWTRLRADRRVRRLLAGANATVVGILLAALITPVGTTAIRSPIDVAVAVAGALALAGGRVPPIAVVVACALIGELAGRLG